MRLTNSFIFVSDIRNLTVGDVFEVRVADCVYEVGRDFRLPTAPSSRHFLLRNPVSVMLRGTAIA